MSLASDQEKYDGRLRNKILPASSKQGKISFTLPLHKRIGSQFKCFLEVESKKEAEKIVSMEENFESLYELAISTSQHKNRVYFLLKDYAEAKSVDGFTNNILYPV